MRMFDVQGIEINAPRGRVFDFLREPGNLPKWAHAFVSAENGRARLQTPAGAVEVGLDVVADDHSGVVDWRLEFPDGNVGVAAEDVGLQNRRQLHPRREEESCRTAASDVRTFR